MEIKLGNYELIYSGVIITIDNHPITIKLPDEIEGDFTLVLNFVVDKENKEAVTKYTPIDKFTLQIDFKNFNGFQGGGNTNLITLGTLRNQPLYMNYRVFDLSNVGKTLMYNIYVGKEASNGN